MNRTTKCLLTAVVLMVALVAFQPQRAEAQWGAAVVDYGVYNTGYYTPYYYQGYLPQYYSAYRSGFAQPVPYATYYSYRPFYDYAPPARAWVQELSPPAASWAVPVAAPCNCR